MIATNPTRRRAADRAPNTGGLTRIWRAWRELKRELAQVFR